MPAAAANMHWEYVVKEIKANPDQPSRSPPIDWTKLTPTFNKLGQGKYGAVWEFAAGDRLVAGKESFGALNDGAGNTVDDLLLEWQAYADIYKSAGLHPNLCNVYGIATLEVNGEPKRMLLTEAVSGVDAMDVSVILRKCLRIGYITAQEYMGALQS